MSPGDGIASDQLLAGVDPEFTRLLLATGREVALRRGEVLYLQGDAAEDIFLVAQGAITISTRLDGGGDATVAVLGRPALFGSAALIAGPAAREATAVAALDSTLLAFPKDATLALLDEHPTAAAAVRTALVRQVLELSQRVVESLHLPAPERIRRRLAAVAAAHPDAVLPITQSDLASMTGTSRATVNKVLAEEVAKGTLRVGRGTITVLVASAL